MHALDRDQALQEFGQRLRRERERCGLTQEQLAAAAGLHWTHVGLRGQRDPRLPTLIALRRALDVEWSALMD